MHNNDDSVTYENVSKLGLKTTDLRCVCQKDKDSCI